uniref:Venom protein 55.1 n=1 Tax=Lychas mucronatus TaxID=172552 RepID=VP55_LYCMC|nr:RecName: Full=Venom protein 55.1; Flags: Precursor [Lychas mucronatus]
MNFLCILFVVSLISSLSKCTTSSMKRELDLGMSRGHSGSQVGKALLGIQSANRTDGPGRKRRSFDLYALVNAK